jgi:hypothetical protein
MKLDLERLKNLPNGEVAISVGVVLLSYYVISTITSWRKLRHFPGPLIAPFSYYFIWKTTSSGRAWQIYYNVNKKYGPLARIGPNDLMTDDPEIIRRMSSARSQYMRGVWYKSLKLNPYEDSIFSLRDTPEHDKMKAKVAAAYGGKENLLLESGLDSQITNFIHHIRAKYLSTDSTVVPFDFGRASQYLTLDLISKVAYGEEFGFVASDADLHDYIRTVEIVVPVIQLTGEIPFLQKVFLNPLLLHLTGPKVGDKKGVGRLMT